MKAEELLAKMREDRTKLGISMNEASRRAERVLKSYGLTVEEFAQRPKRHR